MTPRGKTAERYPGVRHGRGHRRDDLVDLRVRHRGPERDRDRGVADALGLGEHAAAKAEALLVELREVNSAIVHGDADTPRLNAGENGVAPFGIHPDREDVAP